MRWGEGSFIEFIFHEENRKTFDWYSVTFEEKIVFKTAEKREKSEEN